MTDRRAAATASAVVLDRRGDLGQPPFDVLDRDLVHAGLGRQEQQQLGKVNVLLLDPEQSPLSADELSAVMRNFEPDVIVPAGYDAAAGKPGDLLNSLLSELGVKDLEVQSRVTFTRASLPDTRTTVLLAPSA